LGKKPGMPQTQVVQRVQASEYDKERLGGPLGRGCGPTTGYSLRFRPNSAVRRLPLGVRQVTLRPNRPEPHACQNSVFPLKLQQLGTATNGGPLSHISVLFSNYWRFHGPVDEITFKASSCSLFTTRAVSSNSYASSCRCGCFLRINSLRDRHSGLPPKESGSNIPV